MKCSFVSCFVLLFIISGLSVQLAHAQSALDMMRGRRTTTAQTPSDTLASPTKELPQFPGGYKAMMEYIAYRVKYPRALRKRRYNLGTVTVNFLIQANGKVQDVQVTTKPTPPDIAEELGDYVTSIVRVFSRMPRWKPARVNGMPINYQYSLPFQVEID